MRERLLTGTLIDIFLRRQRLVKYEFLRVVSRPKAEKAE